MGSSPKTPKPTAAQQAFEVEQRRALNKETEEENRRRKALSRGQLGAVTLLSGLDATTNQVPASSSSSTSSGSAGVLDGSSASASGVNKGTARVVGGPKKKRNV